MAERLGFMFYESYRDAIELVRSMYGNDAAGAFCLELIYYGVRGESHEKLNDVMQATLETIKPYIEISKERRDETAKRLEQYYRLKHKSGNSTSTPAENQEQAQPEEISQ